MRLFQTFLCSTLVCAPFQAHATNDIENFQYSITGAVAELIYQHLDEHLIVESFLDKDSDQSVTLKRGWSISCWQRLDRQSLLASYGCGQYFFLDGYTTNSELSYEVATADPDKEVFLLELQYQGDIAAKLFHLGEQSFPEGMEICQPEQTCRYQRMVRAADLSCYERLTESSSLRYDCMQFLHNLEGYAIPGGGDPIIGVVLGQVSIDSTP
ncbi:MAG: hypothetical protein ACOH5I_06570 [Oligoflexus sp.]